MSIQLISEEPLTSNSALFKNSEEAEQNLGNISWNNPTEEGGEWFVTFAGLDAAGATISETEVEITEEETFNPTKVFWALVRVAKAILCPECV